MFGLCMKSVIEVFVSSVCFLQAKVDEFLEKLVRAEPLLKEELSRAVSGAGAALDLPDEVFDMLVGLGAYWEEASFR